MTRTRSLQRAKPVHVSEEIRYMRAIVSRSIDAEAKNAPPSGRLFFLATKSIVSKQMKDYSSVFLRLALGISFLAAVADRFGLWGSFGQPNVAWGDFSHFVAYTRKLNWFTPSGACLQYINPGVVTIPTTRE